MCAADITVEGNRITKIRGDRSDPLTRGFMCSKGLKAEEQHHGPKRLRTSLRRRQDGSHEPLAYDTAVAEIGSRLCAIIEKFGPSSVALYTGTQAFMNSLGRPLARAFLDATGSPGAYSTMTIDQSAKWIADARIGSFAAGGHPFERSDVWMSIGTNPVISLLGGPGLSGFAGQDPVKALKDAKSERGLKLIVIDPRYSETARFADLFLQPRPGSDAVLLAAIVHVVLREGWHDREFCKRHVNGLEDLRAALAHYTPERAAVITGVPTALIIDAARMFARDGSVGRVGTGTGTDMGPYSNLAEHFAQTLNIVCGRYLRAGDPVPNPGVLQPATPRYEEVIPPFREWESSPKGRVHGTGRIKGLMMTATLADEILAPGEDRIRALICVGGNPAVALPDEKKAIKALGSLDLLVTIDPQMTATAKLADYVIAPKVQYERTDHTGTMEFLLGAPYANYTEPVIQPEQDMDVVDEWRFFCDLAATMGMNLVVGGTTLDTSKEITEEMILNAINPDPRVPFDDVRRSGGGRFHPLDQAVLPAREDRAGLKVELIPDDVAAEIADLSASIAEDRITKPDQLILTVRRERDVMNSFLTDFVTTQQRRSAPPLYVNPLAMTKLELDAGDAVRVVSSGGSLVARVEPDNDLREDTVQMTHCWKGLAMEGERPGATASLVESEVGLQAINRMPVMSAIPVSIQKVTA